eukprot:UN26044
MLLKLVSAAILYPAFNYIKKHRCLFYLFLYLQLHSPSNYCDATFFNDPMVTFF